MSETTITRWTSDRAGCIFAGSSNRTADELNASVVLLAMEQGWTPADASELRDLVESTDGWLDSDDDSQWLSDESLAADQWLTEHIAPEGYVFHFDDGFYLSAESDLDENGDWVG
jgi:hypothetical protein